MSKSLQSLKSINLSEKLPMYKPTPYLKNRYFQSLYAIKSPYIEMKFSREKVFFPDGGHISLDWANKT
jgi:predicted alpha/beta-fold hydrolase